MEKAELKALFEKAHEAGHAAATASVPEPMHVAAVDPATGAVIKRYAPVMEGVCGFAWITIRPGNSPAANWAKKNWGARAAYGGGTQIWVGAYDQSMTRKEAYAGAFAKVLQDAGIKAYAGSRMD